MTEPEHLFPEGFLWGASTAAYQIEGAWNVNGRGESIWDRFSHTPGLVANGDTGDVACDHYHRWRDDVALMRQLGLKAYRLSIAWPRLLPAGRGRVNEAGLDFYDRLIDALWEAQIEPFVTLYHWDLPQALQDEGGWGDRAVCGAFADYAAVVARRLGDRVRKWTTFNEPWCIAWLGHGNGEHAPGLRDEKLSLQVAHHVLVAHGLATQAVRAIAPRAEVGIVLNLWPVDVARDTPEYRREADRLWQKNSGWYVGPILRGYYPPETWEAYGRHAPSVQPGDMARIAQRIDFLGVNFYNRALVGVDGRLPNAEYTEMGWEVYAPGLRNLLTKLHREYKPPPIYVTENGAAFADEASPDGRVHDARRVAYLRDHILQAQRAIADGVDVRGYFVWSFMDNFEWAHGYAKRFGLIYVDYATQRRVLKDSALWYREVIARNGVAPLRPPGE